ncbi:MAG: hypothetical protein HC808_07345 [Candidatus Competibacteraceae bacterium]|nr:hypothetical protein [Candidatus Competibacteraceae bacterium]
MRPRLQGDRVTLEISPHRQRETADGWVETQSLYTTVTGRLGEWLEVGASDEQSTSRNHAITGYRNETRLDEHRIQLKVELLP